MCSFPTASIPLPSLLFYVALHQHMILAYGCFLLKGGGVFPATDSGSGVCSVQHLQELLIIHDAT